MLIILSNNNKEKDNYINLIQLVKNLKFGRDLKILCELKSNWKKYITTCTK